MIIVLKCGRMNHLYNHVLLNFRRMISRLLTIIILILTIDKLDPTKRLYMLSR